MEKNTTNYALSKHLASSILSEKEARVYVALLELGGSFPSKIATRAQLNRTTTYAILTNLAIKGLISELQKQNKLYYQINRPEDLMRFAKERVQLSKDNLKKTQKIIPEIDAIFSLLPNKPRVLFYRGCPEVYAIHQDHISGNAPYEMLAWANGSQIANFLPNTLRKKYIQKKESLSIKTRTILPDTAENRNYNKTIYSQVPKKIQPRLRFIPPDQFPYMSEITIYGTNKISILNFEKEMPIGIIIEDQTIHDMLVMIFNVSWNGTIRI